MLTPFLTQTIRKRNKFKKRRELKNVRNEIDAFQRNKKPGRRNRHEKLSHATRKNPPKIWNVQYNF